MHTPHHQFYHQFNQVYFLSTKMGGMRAIEDRPTPKEVYNWRLYSEALIIATGSLLQVSRSRCL